MQIGELPCRTFSQHRPLTQQTRRARTVLSSGQIVPPPFTPEAGGRMMILMLLMSIDSYAMQYDVI